MRSNVSRKTFEVTMWTLCGLSTLFLISRFAIRFWKKGRLRRSDYFLVVALPCVFASASLLHSILDELYAQRSELLSAQPEPSEQQISAGSRLTSAIELLWVTIYCVKASFFTQFKFHKPPYAYISPRLTRYYWTAISICGVAFVFTLTIPAVLCPSSAKCHYIQYNTLAWEVTLTTLDIATDLLVISIPASLIWMANFTLSRAAINTSFKSMSVFTVAIAATRLALQYRSKQHRVDYVVFTFWLVVEAAVAVIAASISSYRIVVVDYLADRKTHESANPTRPAIWRLLGTWRVARQKDVAKTTTPQGTRLELLSQLSNQQSAQPSTTSL